MKGEGLDFAAEAEDRNDESEDGWNIVGAVAKFACVGVLHGILADEVVEAAGFDGNFGFDENLDATNAEDHSE